MDDLDIMLEVNTMTPAKEARLRKDFVTATGEAPLYITMCAVHPALDMAVGFESELAAYKLVYYYREYNKSSIKVVKGIADEFRVVFTPNKA